MQYHLFQDLGQTECIDGGRFRRNRAEHHADLPELQEGVHPETRAAGQKNREIQLLFFLKNLHLLLAHDGARNGQRVLAAEHLVGQVQDLAVNLGRRRSEGGN